MPTESKKPNNEGKSNNKKTNNSKSKTNNKTSNSKTSNNKQKNLHKNNNQFGDSIIDEIILICLILLSVIMAISMFSQSMGFFGNVIRTFLKGLLGFGGYVVPFVVCIFCVWFLVSDKRNFVPIKIIGSVSLLIFISTFAEAIGSKEVESVVEFWKNGSALNGGFIGGVINLFMTKVFGKGRFIVIIALILISFIAASGKSIIDGISYLISSYTIHKRQNEEKVKSRAEQIRLKEQERERRYVEKQRRYEQRQSINPFVHKKQKKGIFDIRINENEGLHPKEEKTEPFIEVPEFKSTPIEKQDKPEKIYDFNKARNEAYQDEPIPVIKSKKEALEDTIVNLAVSELLKNFDISQINEDDILNQIKKETMDIVSENKSKTIDEINNIENEEYDILINDVSDNNYVSSEEVNDHKNDYKDKEENVLSTESHDKDKLEQDDIEIVHGDGGNPLEEFNSNENFNEDNSVSEIVKSAERSGRVSQQKPMEAKPEIKYVFPPMELLGKNSEPVKFGSKAEMIANAKKLEETLASFGVEAKVIQINRGPTVTRYELSPSQGVKVSKIVNLADDIALNLAAQGIRIEAPIPGKAAVGIEVPNTETQSVYLRDVLESNEFKNFPSKLAFALGEDIAGNAVVTDIAKMPHLLIAGATGSGKSVCINTLITSILYKAKPDEVKLLLVDPKVVELSIYNGIPHLLIPVVTDPKKAAGALNWAVREMLARYQSFADNSVRDIKGFNAMKREKGEKDLMPQIVIVIDELADLMMAAPGEVEDAICRLAQMARAAGLHLIIATQRPSVDVITGVIKANIPSRMAFAVSSGIDSRTILDSVGAEKLLGKGDMLFSPVGMSKPVRIQGAFVTDKEVENIVSFLKSQGNIKYDDAMIDEITSTGVKSADPNSESDEFFDQAVELVVSKEKASVSMLQRQFRIGYNRAARIMDDLESRGIVGPEEGSKPRKVLMSKAEYEEYMS